LQIGPQKPGGLEWSSPAESLKTKSRSTPLGVGSRIRETGTLVFVARYGSCRAKRLFSGERIGLWRPIL
jgi:hypothetical protein